MLKLRQAKPMAQGGRRYVFLHPEDTSKVVKILKSESKPEKRRQATKWYKRLRPLDHFDDNVREFNAFQQLRAKSPEVMAFFPHCDGLIETDRGFAIMTDCVRDISGSVSLNMQEYLDANGITKALKQALSDYANCLQEYVVITRDIHHHNLMVQQHENALQIIMIDGLGNSDFFPIANYVKWFALRKIKRKIKRFYQKPYMKGV